MRKKALTTIILCLSMLLTPFVIHYDLLAAYNVEVVEKENEFYKITENTFYDFTPDSDGIFQVWYANDSSYMSQALDLTTNSPVSNDPYFFEKGHTYRLDFMYYGKYEDTIDFFKLTRPALACKENNEPIRAKYGDEITLSVDAFSEDGPIKYEWDSLSASDVKFNSSKSSVTFKATQSCYPYCNVSNNSDSKVVYFDVQVADLEPYFTNECFANGEDPYYQSKYILVDYGKDLDIEIAFKNGDASKSTSHKWYIDRELSDNKSNILSLKNITYPQEIRYETFGTNDVSESCTVMVVPDILFLADADKPFFLNSYDNKYNVAKYYQVIFDPTKVNTFSLDESKIPEGNFKIQWQYSINYKSPTTVNEKTLTLPEGTYPSSVTAVIEQTLPGGRKIKYYGIISLVSQDFTEIPESRQIEVVRGEDAVLSLEDCVKSDKYFVQWYLAGKDGYPQYCLRDKNQQLSIKIENVQKDTIYHAMIGREDIGEEAFVKFVITVKEPDPTPSATPTASSAPKATPSAKPSSKPTASAKPTTAPTAKPTAGISSKPTNAVTQKPTLTPVPTTTKTPSVSPSVTSAPSDSSKAKILDFVNRIYKYVLDREPEEDGARFWSDELYAFRRTGAEVGLQFIFSEEFTGRNLSNEDFVTVLYRTFFGREPEEGGFKFWTGALADGTLDRRAVAEGFIYSQEWADTCASYGIRSGGDLKPQGVIEPTDLTYSFVERLYTTAMGRGYDEEGRQYWASALANFEFTGEQAGASFFLSDEMNSYGLSDSEFLSRLYKTFMDRDADSDGEAYWLGVMASGTPRSNVVFGFTRSPEFTEKCVEARILPYL